MAQSAHSTNEKSDSLTGISPFWQRPSACAPNKWEDWLKNFFLIADLKEKCQTRALLKEPDAVMIEPYPKPEKAPDSGSELPQEKAARENRNAAQVLKVDAINQEARRKGPKIGHGAFYNEVDNSVKSRLILSLGEEGRRKLDLKHPTLDMENETVRSLVAKLDALFKLEVNTTYERLLLFSRNQKSGESLESYHNALSELAKTCSLGTLKNELVKDLLVAKMQNKEVQMKFIREKTTPEEVLKYIILFERGTLSSNTMQKTVS